MQIIADDYNAFEQRYGTPQEPTVSVLPFSLGGDENGDTI